MIIFLSATSLQHLIAFSLAGLHKTVRYSCQKKTNVKKSRAQIKQILITIMVAKPNY